MVATSRASAWATASCTALQNRMYFASPRFAGLPPFLASRSRAPRLSHRYSVTLWTPHAWAAVSM